MQTDRCERSDSSKYVTPKCIHSEKIFLGCTVIQQVIAINSATICKNLVDT